MKTNTLEENILCPWLCRGEGSAQAQDLMSGINALPAARQKVQFDAITGMKSPPASIKPSFQPQNTVSLLSCQHSTPQRTTMDKR